MSDTPNIGFEFLETGQAQKEVSVNRNSVILDALMGGVISRTETAPPGSPAEGDAYIVAGTATGVWTGHEDDIAYYFGSVWNFLPPTVGEGHPVWDRNAGEFVQWGMGSPQAWTPAVITGDASGITYTPADVTDWDGDTDPGNTAPALDQLAERVNDLELGSGGLDGLRFTSDTGSTADSDPGNGLKKWNNATQSSATVLFYDNQTADGVSLATFFAGLPASGYIYEEQEDDDTKWQLWKWSAVVDGTGYRKFTVTLQAFGGSIADDKTVLVDFNPSGAVSSVNALTGAVSLNGGYVGVKGADIASAGTTDLGAATGDFVDVTGTTTITALGTITAGIERLVRFTGVLTLTHNATSLILPTGANITTAAGDTARFRSLGSGNWVCVSYQRKSGAALVETAQTQCIPIACSDETTPLTAGTAKVTFRMPYAFTLTDVRASVTTAPTGGTLLTVDVNEAGSTILSTKLTFDASETTTTTAATPRVISDSSLADDAEITIDIDAVGSTIAGAGLKVYLIGTRA